MQTYDKRIKSDINSSIRAEVDKNKLKTDLDLEIDKLKMLKQKYEWSSLIENMSQNVSNIITLKSPRLPEVFEYREPKLLMNIILAIIIAIIFNGLAIIGLELKDKKLTYSNMDDNTVIADKNNIDLSNLQTKTVINNIKSLSVVSLTNISETEYYLNLIKRELPNIKLILTNENSPFDNHIKNIMSAENLIFIGKLGYTERKPFNKLKEVSRELKKEVINTFLIV